MTQYIAVVVFALLGGLLIYLGLSVKEKQAKIEDLEADNLALHARAAESDRAVEQALIDIAPLLEKTDWITGRWHGQFQTLVDMEAQRNAAVDKVRRSLMNSPTLQEFWKSNGTKFLKDAGTTAAKEIFG